MSPRKWQYRLRSLALVVTIASVAIALLANRMHHMQDRENAAKKLAAVGFQLRTKPIDVWRPMLQPSFSVQEVYPPLSDRASAADYQLIATFDEVRSVILYGTWVRSDHLEFLNQLPNLRQLQLIDVAVSPEGWSNFKPSDTLEALTVKRRFAIDVVSSQEIVALTARSRSLQCLHVSQVALDKDAIRAIVSLPNLTNLSLADCKLTDDSLAEIAEARGLTELDISDNHDVTRAGVENLRFLPLKQLNLFHCSVSYEEAVQLSRRVSGARPHPDDKAVFGISLPSHEDPFGE